jgi:outer membrane receptor protein involved in Fe transport
VKYSLWCIAFIFIYNLSAQNTGSLSGSVSDSENNHPLSNAEILLKNTIFGAVSAEDGSFLIHNIPAGDYIISISYMGYSAITQNINLNSGENLHLTFNLEPAFFEINEIMVEADKPYSAASSRLVRKIDMKLRPTRSAQDMLQLVPGLFITQHAGGGKAEQIFLRGFDADHGTDVAIDVDGLPVNMVSHGHGQGYADLHFLITEVVEKIDVHKGPYFAQYGNFATAGAVSFTTKDHLENNMLHWEQGEFSTYKLTTAFQIPSDGLHQNAYFAAQFYQTDGPFTHEQGFSRFNLFGKFHTHLSSTSKLVLSMDAFSSAWDASGQIPQRAVDSGLINRYGGIDNSEGGTTGRQNVNLEYHLKNSANNSFKIQSYVSNYDFKLFSNFTLFLQDTVNGDMIEQVDSRKIYGLNTHYNFSDLKGDIHSSTTIGGGFRSDDIKLNLFKSPDRLRSGSLVDSYVAERNFFLWVQQQFLFGTDFRLQLGLRGDYFTFNVEDFLEEHIQESTLPHASGYYQKTLLNPKMNFVYSPLPNFDLYINGGSGFHSNDARNIIIRKKTNELIQSLQRKGMNRSEIDEALGGFNFERGNKAIETLPRAYGAELGFRTHLFGNLNLAVAAWLLDLEKELVYIGDEGTTEISGATRRIGVDIELRYQVLSWFWADGDLNISRGKFINEPESANNIPLAPRVTSTGGLSVVHPTGFEASLRYFEKNLRC